MLTKRGVPAAEAIGGLDSPGAIMSLSANIYPNVLGTFKLKSAPNDITAPG